MEWDTAAAHIIANESKTPFQKYQNMRLSNHRYNKIFLLNDWFLVGDMPLAT
jgi:3'-phosphoadenosine 5'-phosphosulfate (PAPS) 3'-phosphatase